MNKNNIKIFFCLFAVLISFFLVPFSFFANQVTGQYWTDDFEDHFPLCIENSPDDGFIICGATYSRNGVSINYADILVIRVDSEGNILWQKQFGGAGDEWAYGITKTSDNAYIIASWSYSFDNMGYLKSWLIKIADDGTVLWQKTYGDKTFAYKAYELSDQNFIVVGGMYEGSGQSLKAVAWVVKIGADGNVIWTRTLRSESEDMHLLGATILSNAEFIAWGSNRLYKFNIDGTLIWQKAIDEEIGEIKSLVLTTSGDYLIAAHDGYEYYIQPEILCYTSDGTFRWAKKLIVEENDADNLVYICPLFPKGDGTVIGFADFVGYLASDGNMYWGRGVLSFDENGTADPKAFIYDIPYLSWTFSSKSAVIARDGNVAFSMAVDFVNSYWGIKFGLIKTGEGNKISGNCSETTEIPLLWEDSIRSSLCDIQDQLSVIGSSAVDTSPYNFVYGTAVKGITTFCPVITQVNKLQNPLRLEILGYNLQPLYGLQYNEPQVIIEGNAVPISSSKSATRIIAKKGTALKNLLPKGVPVCIQVRADHGLPLYKSDCFTYTR